MLRSATDKKKKSKKNPPANGHRDTYSPREGKPRKAEDQGSGSGESGGGKKGPEMSERASAGMKAAQHLSKAARGGTLRKGFSLWRASSHLGVAAAGAGEVIKRHPAPAALIGGAVAAAAIFFAARSAAAADKLASAQDNDDEDESSEDDSDEADRGEEEEADDQDASDDDEDGEDDE